MEIFVEIVNRTIALTIFTISSILDVWQVYEYDSELLLLSELKVGENSQ